MKRRDLLLGITLTVLSLIFSLLMLEIGLRLFTAPFPTRYFLRAPHEHAITDSFGAMTGVTQKARVSINSLGLRSDDCPMDNSYKILAIGGSTTECVYIDQEKTWTFLLQKRFNAEAPNRRLWVGNAGRSGSGTRNHLVQMHYILPDYPHLDAILMLVGINDLSRRLAEPGYRPYSLDEIEKDDRLIHQSFNIYPPRHLAADAWYRRTAIWATLRKINTAWKMRHYRQGRADLDVIRWRQYRATATHILDNLPDLTGSLQEYERNLNALIDRANNHGSRIIFMTQPAMWTHGLSPELQQLLWMGGAGDFQVQAAGTYYSVDALADGLDRYNTVLARVCRRRNVELIDLAAMLPHDSTVFYDDCHFNESGSKKVAEILLNYLQSTGFHHTAP